MKPMYKKRPECIPIKEKTKKIINEVETTKKQATSHRKWEVERRVT
jgi:hypothetical protein